MVDDPRRAESLYVVVITLAAVALVLSQFLAWTALQPLSGAGIRTFALVEAAAAAVFVLMCLVGRQPQCLVKVDDEGLHVERAGDELIVPFADVERVAILDAETYYRHFARYRITKSFVNRIHPRLLIVETASGPVVLGPEPSDLPDLQRMLADRASAPYSSSRAGAA